jgi:type VI secretion system protein ImpJ
MTHSSYYKVLWQEGMLVGPHHFQQWDHYQEATRELRVQYLVPYSWGVISLPGNQELLNDCRMIQLTAFRAVFPSGIVVDIPSGDQPPAAREVTAQMFCGTGHALGVYLGLPLQSSLRSSNCCSSASSDLLGNRYLPACVAVPDENSGQNELEIVTARKNLRILFTGEPDDGYERLKIAELSVRDGKIVLNEAYIPPCLTLAASPRLQSLLAALSQELARRIELGARGLSMRSCERLWLLSQASGSLALLKHVLSLQSVHPEAIYRDLLQFAGQLSLLSRQPELPELPPYDHDDLVGTFGRLESVLNSLLEMMSTRLLSKR